jgi:cold shock CspA family protein
MNGKVVKIIDQRMFGFIRGEDDKDYFFHRDDFSGHFNDLVQDLGNKQIAVTFDVTQSKKGLRASNIVRVDGGVRMD